MSNIFEEKQKFTQWWFWTIILGLPILMSIFILSEHFGDHPMPINEVAFVLFLSWAYVLLFWILSLRTKIDSNKIVIQFFPLRKKRIGWDEVDSAEVLNYGNVGGYGIRMLTKYGTVYNIDGQMGLFLQLKNGKKICIGTQRAEELRGFINTLDKAKRLT